MCRYRINFFARPPHPARRCSGTVRFDLREFDAASFGGHSFDLRVHRVLPDHFHNYPLCYREPAKLGHRRIGIYIPDYDLRSTADTALGGYLSAQWRAPKKDHVPVGHGAESWQVAEQPFCAWFHKYRPDAIIANFNQIPAWLKKSGVRVPRDVALAHPALGPDIQE